MKEIGEILKETRETMGISIEEAAEDLKLRVTQIENIEEGNIAFFKDIFYLKLFIRDYSKYLGLDSEEMIDDLNEYLFDYTSKISIEDIKKASKEKVEVKKIASPYTLEKKKMWNVPPIYVYGTILFLIALIIYLILSFNPKDDFDNQSLIGGAYEFSDEINLF
jgi:cytoskeletal protein RodZ